MESFLELLASGECRMYKCDSIPIVYANRVLPAAAGGTRAIPNSMMDVVDRLRAVSRIESANQMGMLWDNSPDLQFVNPSRADYINSGLAEGLGEPLSAAERVIMDALGGK